MWGNRGGAAPRRMKQRMLRLFIGLAVLSTLLVIALSTAGFASPYRYVSEVAGQEKFRSLEVQMAGKIVNGSYTRDGQNHTFLMTDGVATLRVVYPGLLPGAWDPNGSAVVTGRLAAPGLFEARGLLAKCPSKYENRVVA